MLGNFLKQGIVMLFNRYFHVVYVLVQIIFLLLNTFRLSIYFCTFRFIFNIRIQVLTRLGSFNNFLILYLFFLQGESQFQLIYLLILIGQLLFEHLVLIIFCLQISPQFRLPVLPKPLINPRQLNHHPNKLIGQLAIRDQIILDNLKLFFNILQPISQFFEFAFDTDLAINFGLVQLHKSVYLFANFGQLVVFLLELFVEFRQIILHNIFNSHFFINKNI